jgi:hypothetical protein
MARLESPSSIQWPFQTPKAGTPKSVPAKLNGSLILLYNTKGKAVTVAVRNQSDVAKSRRQFRILAVHITRAPVQSEIQIQAAVRTWRGPIDGPDSP